MKGNWLLAMVCVTGCDPAQNASIMQNAGSSTPGVNQQNTLQSAGVERTIAANSRGEVHSCRKEEAVLFQCRNGAKVISICGVRDRVPFARYSLENDNQVEFEYSPRAGGSSPIQWARKGYSGGGEIQYSFSNAGYDYIAYTKVIRADVDKKGRPLHEFEAGVSVRKDGVAISHLRCENPEEAGKSDHDPSRFMPEGEFIFLDE